MAATPRESIEMDFSVIDEDYSRYQLGDGTLLKVKVVVKKIFRSPQTTPQGYPTGVGIDSENAVAAIVPDRLKREPSKERMDYTKDVGEEVKFAAEEERWQSYIVRDGFKILVKPIVTKVIRYQKYNDYGEPIYSANIQSIINIEKAAKSAP